MSSPRGGFAAYHLDGGAYAGDEQALTVIREADDGQILETLLSAQLADADPDVLLAEHGWTRLDGWTAVVDGHRADIARNRPGQPRRIARRIVIGFPADVLADLQQAAGARSTSVSAEVVRRCRTGGTALDIPNA